MFRFKEIRQTPVSGRGLVYKISLTDSLKDYTKVLTTYTPQEKERLDLVAHKFYGDFTLWWIIAKANGIRGKTALEPGIRIRIPGNVSQIVGKFVEMNKSG